MPDLNGKDFVAVVRLSDGENNTIAEVGQTCEKVPAGKHGGTASDTLALLLASYLIAPVTADPPAVDLRPAAGPRLAVPATRFTSDVPDPDPVAMPAKGEA